MIVNAYLLLADDSWLDRSLRNYYPFIHRITACYDENSRGFTGCPIDITPARQTLQRCDTGTKVQWLSAPFYRSELSPLEVETKMRETGLAEAGSGADWIIQLDNDEILPDPDALRTALIMADSLGAIAIEWPMRTFFRQLSDSQFLEVCGKNGESSYSYQGAIAVRPGVQLVLARWVKTPRLRFITPELQHNLLASEAALSDPQVIPITAIQPDQAIWHFSWARSEDNLRTKLQCWGHAHQFNGRRYMQRIWRPSDRNWPKMKDFHPFLRDHWPALKCTTLKLSELK